MTVQKHSIVSNRAVFGSRVRDDAYRFGRSRPGRSRVIVIPAGGVACRDLQRIKELCDPAPPRNLD